MMQMELRRMRLRLLAGAFFVGAMAAFVPVSPAIAQARVPCEGFPTSPIWSNRSGRRWSTSARWRRTVATDLHGGAGDEEMQEFFRRFFGVPMPNVPRQGPRPNRPQDEEQPRGVGSGFILTATASS